MYTVKYFGFDKTAIQKVEYPDKIQFFNDAGTEVHVINRRAPRSDFLLVNHKIICEADQPELFKNLNLPGGARGFHDTRPEHNPCCVWSCSDQCYAIRVPVEWEAGVVWKASSFGTRVAFLHRDKKRILIQTIALDKDGFASNRRIHEREYTLVAEASALSMFGSFVLVLYKSSTGSHIEILLVPNVDVIGTIDATGVPRKKKAKTGAVVKTETTVKIEPAVKTEPVVKMETGTENPKTTVKTESKTESLEKSLEAPQNKMLEIVGRIDASHNTIDLCVTPSNTWLLMDKGPPVSVSYPLEYGNPLPCFRPEDPRSILSDRMVRLLLRQPLPLPDSIDARIKHVYDCIRNFVLPIDVPPAPLAIQTSMAKAGILPSEIWIITNLSKIYSLRNGRYVSNSEPVPTEEHFLAGTPDAVIVVGRRLERKTGRNRVWWAPAPQAYVRLELSRVVSTTDSTTNSTTNSRNSMWKPLREPQDPSDYAFMYFQRKNARAVDMPVMPTELILHEESKSKRHVLPASQPTKRHRPMGSFILGTTPVPQRLAGDADVIVTPVVTTRVLRSDAIDTWLPIESKRSDFVSSGALDFAVSIRSPYIFPTDTRHVPVPVRPQEIASIPFPQATVLFTPLPLHEKIERGAYWFVMFSCYACLLEDKTVDRLQARIAALKRSETFVTWKGMASSALGGTPAEVDVALSEWESRKNLLPAGEIVRVVNPNTFGRIGAIRVDPRLQAMYYVCAGPGHFASATAFFQSTFGKAPRVWPRLSLHSFLHKFGEFEIRMELAKERNLSNAYMMLLEERITGVKRPAHEWIAQFHTLTQISMWTVFAMQGAELCGDLHSIICYAAFYICRDESGNVIRRMHASDSNHLFTHLPAWILEEHIGFLSCVIPLGELSQRVLELSKDVVPHGIKHGTQSTALVPYMEPPEPQDGWFTDGFSASAGVFVTKQIGAEQLAVLYANPLWLSQLEERGSATFLEQSGIEVPWKDWVVKCRYIAVSAAENRTLIRVRERHSAPPGKWTKTAVPIRSRDVVFYQSGVIGPLESVNVRTFEAPRESYFFLTKRKDGDIDAIEKRVLKLNPLSAVGALMDDDEVYVVFELDRRRKSSSDEFEGMGVRALRKRDAMFLFATFRADDRHFPIVEKTRRFARVYSSDLRIGLTTNPPSMDSDEFETRQAGILSSPRGLVLNFEHVPERFYGNRSQLVTKMDDAMLALRRAGIIVALSVEDKPNDDFSSLEETMLIRRRVRKKLLDVGVSLDTNRRAMGALKVMFGKGNQVGESNIEGKDPKFVRADNATFSKWQRMASDIGDGLKIGLREGGMYIEIAYIKNLEPRFLQWGVSEEWVVASLNDNTDDNVWKAETKIIERTTQLVFNRLATLFN
jgi:hypothetical protein